jgi:hypothetical protein
MWGIEQILERCWVTIFNATISVYCREPSECTVFGPEIRISDAVDNLKPIAPFAFRFGRFGLLNGEHILHGSPVVTCRARLIGVKIADIMDRYDSFLGPLRGSWL